MISNQSKRLKIICSLVIFPAIAVMSLGGASYLPADADELLSVRALPTGPDEEYFSDQIIVEFRAEIRAAAEVELHGRLGTPAVHTGCYAGFEVLQVPKGENGG
jgi:hypothetical protein